MSRSARANECRPPGDGRNRQRGRRTALIVGGAFLALLTAAVWANWDWIPFLRDFESLGRNAQGYSEYRHRETGIVFVRLPGGTFWMGASSTPGSPNYSRCAFPDETPHRVSLRPFLVAKYETTQREWLAVVGSNPSHFRERDTGLPPALPRGPTESELPVESVSWEDIQEFEARTGLALPTEAQWEYACRAGTTGDLAGTGHVSEMAWHQRNSDGRTHPVGRKQPNQFGLHDMHGNVWEWCEDSHVSYPTGPSTEPCSRRAGAPRVLRGGAWDTSPLLIRSAFRRDGFVVRHLPRSRGFRVAKTEGVPGR